MSNSFINGFFLGLVCPLIAIILYVGYYKQLDITETIVKLYKIERLSHVLSLSTLVNLPLFFLFLNTKKYKNSRGLIFSMFIFATLVIILIFLK